MNGVLKLLFLPYPKKKLLAQSLVSVSAIRVALWLFPFKALNKWLYSLTPSDSRDQEVEWDVIDNVSASVEFCSGYVPYASCLTQALATRTLLGLKGQKSELQFGVDKDEAGKFIAHAWVEVDGKIIIGKLPHHHNFNVLKASGSTAR